MSRSAPVETSIAYGTLSGDGATWWDGSQWAQAVADGGNWRWDGSQWQPFGTPSLVSLGLARRILPRSVRLVILAVYTRAIAGTALNPRHGAERAQLVALRRLTGLRTVAGPFAGLEYVDEAAGSEYGPKLLGTYELELHHIIERIIDLAYPTIINIGAGEGYYAVSYTHLTLPTICSV